MGLSLLLSNPLPFYYVSGGFPYAATSPSFLLGYFRWIVVDGTFFLTFDPSPSFCCNLLFFYVFHFFSSFLPERVYPPPPTPPPPPPPPFDFFLENHPPLLPERFKQAPQLAFRLYFASGLIGTSPYFSFFVPPLFHLNRREVNFSPHGSVFPSEGTD